MTWPRATDYSSAIQHPTRCFSDPDLARGQVVTDPVLGLPLAWSGNFASVYKIVGEDDWAVKCFTREVHGLQKRYALISKHLLENPRKFAVKLEYLEQGIRIQGKWYPIVKMRWIDGLTLNEFVRERLGQSGLFEQLGQLWLRLAGELRDAGIAHGDLQHGNVLLVPGSRASALVLRLIDYDGMWVPSLADTPAGEVGHPNFQHPDRLRQGGYNREIDRFSHLVIYTAFRSLAIAGKSLWNRFDNDENLLFREADFREPNKSKLWPELFALGDPQIQSLVGHLLDACRRPLTEVPGVWELVNDNGIQPLSGEKVQRLRYVFPDLQWPQATPSKPVISIPPPPMDWIAPPTRPSNPDIPPPAIPPIPVTVVQPLEPEVVTIAPMSIDRILNVELVEEVPFVAIPEPILPPQILLNQTVLPKNPNTLSTMRPSTAPPKNKLPPPPPAEPTLPWPELSGWMRLGLAREHILARYWPITLAIAMVLSMGMVLAAIVVVQKVRRSEPPGKESRGRIEEKDQRGVAKLMEPGKTGEMKRWIKIGKSRFEDLVRGEKEVLQVEKSSCSAKRVIVQEVGHANRA